jgi:DNA-binding transcriptional LysR family regulator
MKTLLGFDSWTEGSPHFQRLVPELERLGYALVLVHLGSWGHDTGRLVEERIGQLLVRDISYYGGKNFQEILETEKPEGVIFFSTRSLAHQAFNIYCRFLGIPTVHLYHGLVTVQAVRAGEAGVFRLNFWNAIHLVRTRLAKNLFRIWPTYWRALLAARAPFSYWAAFARELLDKVQGRLAQAPLAASTTSGCVYTSADVEHMKWMYNVPEQMIAVVGNPDLAGFGLDEPDLGHALRDRHETLDEVIYIDTALVEAGIAFADGEAFVAHLSTTAAELAAQGLKLVVKLHPAHQRTAVPALLAEAGVAVCGQEEFVSRLKRARASIVEPSTAALIPALMGLPLLLAEYGPLSGQAYGQVLTSYPRSVHLTEILRAAGLIEQQEAVTAVEETGRWIEQNSGPLPASLMPSRAAQAIVATVKAGAVR